MTHYSCTLHKEEQLLQIIIKYTLFALIQHDVFGGMAEHLPLPEIGLTNEVLSGKSGKICQKRKKVLVTVLSFSYHTANKC